MFLFPNIQYIVEKEREQHVIAEYTTNDRRKVLIKQSMHYESASQINRIKWQYFIDDKFHSVQNMDMRLFFPQELNSYLRQIGFNIIHKFGDFTERKFDDNSEKQIYILELKKYEQNDKIIDEIQQKRCSSKNYKQHFCCFQ